MSFYRTTTSRGNKYRQLVESKWDKEKKQSRIHFIKHVGTIIEKDGKEELIPSQIKFDSIDRSYPVGKLAFFWKVWYYASISRYLENITGRCLVDTLHRGFSSRQLKERAEKANWPKLMGQGLLILCTIAVLTALLFSQFGCAFRARVEGGWYPPAVPTYYENYYSGAVIYSAPLYPPVLLYPGSECCWVPDHPGQYHKGNDGKKKDAGKNVIRPAKPKQERGGKR